MKKLSTFFLTLLLALVSTTAFAFDYTAGQVIKIGEAATTPETGQAYLMYNVSVGGYIYPKNGVGTYSYLYPTEDTSVVYDGMAAEDAEQYLVELTGDPATLNYDIKFSDYYLWSYDSQSYYAFLWTSGPGNTFWRINGTDDTFSIVTNCTTYGGSNFSLYTWAASTGYGLCNYSVSDPASAGKHYQYQFLPVEFVDPVIELPEDNDYEIGDQITVDHKTCTVVGDNLFVNGGFNDGMNGWTAGGYTTAADPDNFEIASEGGYNDGAYLVASSAGATNAKTPSQAIAVEVGKWYMLVAYTSGKTPDSNNLRYSALFEMEDATTEASHTEGTTTYSNTIIELDWGADAGATTDEWTQTIDIFEATTEYVGMRMGWSGGSYDGFQLYEVEVVELGEPTVSGETSHECVAEVDHWTIEGNTNGDFHYNDWSTEDDASGMEVPFLEYWVWSGEGNLSAATISHETLAMEPGTYEVSLDVRIFSEAGNEIGEGTTLTVNGESVDIAAAGTADVYGTETEVYGTYTLTCTLEEVGDLEISINIPEGVEYNWIAFKNLSVTLVEEEPEPEIEGETSHECVAEVDHWTIEGNTNGDFHYNDWSTEDDASGMVVPFLEYWVWSGEGNLSAATISHETLTMEPGTYEVSLDVRIFSEAGNEIGEGTTLTANGESVDIAAAGTADVYGTETEVYGTYTLTCEVGEDGVLDISLDIPEGVEYNWIAFKNLSVTYVGEEVVDNSYQFVCTDWSSIDLGRVTNDNISYDEDANTITVNAGTGTNNVALSNGLSAPYTTADYTVSSEQNWYVVVASNISTELTDSRLWWMNGVNDGEFTPDYIVELESGEILIAWDLSATTIDTNLQDDENYLDGWTGFGLTSTTGTSVVSDINFYTWSEAVAKYPELEEAIATEISSVETAGTELVKDGIFDMAGRRVSKAIKGVYIVDGKKVLVK